MAEDALDFIARKHEQPADDPPRAPTEPQRGVARRTPIPGELALDRSEVVESRLDLDDEQGLGPWVEGDHVDPAVRSTLDDLDLARSLPAGRPKPPLHVAGASRMDEVSLAVGTDDDGLAEDQVRFETEGAAHSIDDIERGIPALILNGRDVTARHADRIGNLLLSQSEAQPRVSRGAREGDSD